jgi:hypothetical protein
LNLTMPTVLVLYWMMPTERSYKPTELLYHTALATAISCYMPCHT